MQMLRNKTS